MTAKPDLADFALGTFSVAGAPPFAGLVIDGRVIAVGAESVLQLLRHWDESLANLRKLADAFRGNADIRAQSAPLDALRIHPPVDLPPSVYCAGMNYRKHVIDLIMSQSGTADEPNLGADRRAAAEKVMDVRAKSGEPFVFIKSVSAIVGARDPVQLPDGVTRPDWELELGVVIGPRAMSAAKTR